MWKVISVLIILLIMLLSIFFSLEIYSSRIPEKWQYIGRGYTPEEVRERLANALEPYDDVVIKDDEEIYTLQRPFGKWTLFVRFDTNSHSKISRGSHFRYDSNLSDTKRMRTFSNPKGRENRNW